MSRSYSTRRQRRSGSPSSVANDIGPHAIDRPADPSMSINGYILAEARRDSNRGRPNARRSGGHHRARPPEAIRNADKWSAHGDTEAATIAAEKRGRRRRQVGAAPAALEDTVEVGSDPDRCRSLAGERAF